MATVKKCEFLYSVPKISLMRDHFDEVAFVGRSNAGKSSLINAICAKRDLARMSKTPGRTRHAVAYDILFEEAGLLKPITFIDLPGFGFAKMSKAEALQCEHLIFSYITNRGPLRLLIVLLDIRRSLDERERRIIDVAQKRGVDVIVVLSKCDKIPLSKRKPQIHQVANEVGLDNTKILLHSTQSDKYAKALQKAIFDSM